MSLILLASAVAAAAASAGLFAARRASKRDAVDDASKPKAPSPTPMTPPTEQPKLPGLCLALGDVVSVEADDASSGQGVRRAQVERWLAGALALYEAKSLIGAVFVAPEGMKDEAVATFSPPRKDIAWLSPVELEMSADPPSSLEIGGVVMQRRRRLFVRVARLGKGAPKIGEQALFVEYQATGRAVAVVLRGDIATLAWSGTRFDPGEYDRMGSGDAR